MGHILGVCRDYNKPLQGSPKTLQVQRTILLLRLLHLADFGGFLADEIRIPWNPHGKDHADVGVQVAINSASSAKLMCPSQRWVSDFIQHVPKQHMKSFHHPSFGIMKWFMISFAIFVPLLELLPHRVESASTTDGTQRTCFSDQFWRAFQKGERVFWHYAFIFNWFMNPTIQPNPSHPPNLNSSGPRFSMFAENQVPSQEGTGTSMACPGFASAGTLTSKNWPRKGPTAMLRPGIWITTNIATYQSRPHDGFIQGTLGFWMRHFDHSSSCAFRYLPKNRKSQKRSLGETPPEYITPAALMQIVGPGSMGLSSASRIGPPGASIPRIFIAATNG